MSLKVAEFFCISESLSIIEVGNKEDSQNKSVIFIASIHTFPLTDTGLYMCWVTSQTGDCLSD